MLNLKGKFALQADAEWKMGNISVLWAEGRMAPEGTGEGKLTCGKGGRTLRITWGKPHSAWEYSAAPQGSPKCKVKEHLLELSCISHFTGRAKNKRDVTEQRPRPGLSKSQQVPEAAVPSHAKLNLQPLRDELGMSEYLTELFHILCTS